LYKFSGAENQANNLLGVYKSLFFIIMTARFESLSTSLSTLVFGFGAMALFVAASYTVSKIRSNN